MERGHKIALVGANGIGKTTLLKSILGLIKPLSGSVELGENLQIGYFEQESAPDNKTTCIEEIWQEFPSYTQYEVRSALAKCGLTTKHIESQVRVLSGGEQAKVRLCKLINRETNILLLGLHKMDDKNYLSYIWESSLHWSSFPFFLNSPFKNTHSRIHPVKFLRERNIYPKLSPHTDNVSAKCLKLCIVLPSLHISLQ